MKKVVALVLVLVMVLSLATVAFAYAKEEQAKINPVDVIGTYWVVKTLVAQVQEAATMPYLAPVVKIGVPVTVLSVLFNWVFCCNRPK